MSLDTIAKFLAAAFAIEIENAAQQMSNQPTAMIAKINEINRAEGFRPDVCASHDFFDANECMIEAMQALGVPMISACSASADVMNKAWQYAKESEFDLERIDNLHAAG